MIEFTQDADKTPDSQWKNYKVPQIQTQLGSYGGCISNFRFCYYLWLPLVEAFSTFVLIQKWSKKSRLHKKP
jgi:hypothetical protein